jgi:hypothetical protein
VETNAEPPLLSARRNRRLATHVGIGFGAAIATEALAAWWRHPILLNVALIVVPLLGIITCFIRPIRGIGLGMLLACGVALLVLFGICVFMLRQG